MLKTRITELLGIRYPVFQGGMAWVADAKLAAAVSNAGGLGLIGAAAAPGEVVEAMIREAKSLTDRPFGVNVMLMSPFADDVARRSRSSQRARATPASTWRRGRPRASR